MTDAPYILGLFVSRHLNVCNEVRLSVAVVRKSDDGLSILNLSSDWGWRERTAKVHHGRAYDNLGMEGHIYQSNTEGRILIGYEPRYSQVYCVELADAQRMVKTLKDLDRAKARWRKANGYEIGPRQMFAIFAHFVDAKFVVFLDSAPGSGRRPGGLSYRDIDWKFLTIAKGIDLYTDQIAKLANEWVDPWKPRLVSGGASTIAIGP